VHTDGTNEGVKRKDDEDEDDEDDDEEESLIGGVVDSMVNTCSVTEQPKKESDSRRCACCDRMRTPSSVT
jgi:hypothetical protein